jgi:hypothetical protein
MTPPPKRRRLQLALSSSTSHRNFTVALSLTPKVHQIHATRSRLLASDERQARYRWRWSKRVSPPSHLDHNRTGARGGDLACHHHRACLPPGQEPHAFPSPFVFCTTSGTGAQGRNYRSTTIARRPCHLRRRKDPVAPRHRIATMSRDIAARAKRDADRVERPPPPGVHYFDRTMLFGWQ